MPKTIKKKSHPKILKEFEDMLPPLQQSEIALLEQSILKTGILQKIVLWRGYIVDGHNRFRIARKHLIPYETTVLPDSMTKNEVLLWMIENQIGKRNCNLFGKVEVSLKFKESLAKLGKNNQKAAGKAKNNLCHPSDKSKIKKIDVLELIGNYSGVSRNTVSQVQYILKNASPEIISNCRTGHLSIRNAYLKTQDIIRDLRRKNHNQSHYLRDKSKDPYFNNIVCGDCIDIMQQMIKKGYQEMVSCIITSPPYNNGLDYGNGYNDNLPYKDYLDWLAAVFSTASKLLKKGGRVVVNVASMRNRQSEDTFKHPINADLVQQIIKTNCGLKFREEIIWHKYNGTAANFGRCTTPINPTIKTVHEYLLIFCKDQWILPDELSIDSDLTSEEYQKYSQSVWSISSISHNQIHPASFPQELVIPLIKMFSFPGDIILDPFNGSGTTTLCASKTGRKFIGIEQNPEYCNYAYKRMQY